MLTEQQQQHKQRFFYGGYFGFGKAVVQDKKVRSKRDTNRSVVQQSVHAGIAQLKARQAQAIRIKVEAKGITFSLAPSGAALYPHPLGSERFVKFRDVRMISKLPAHPSTEGRVVLAISANDAGPARGTANANAATKVLSYMLAMDTATRELLYKHMAAEISALKPNALRRNRQGRSLRTKDRKAKDMAKAIKEARAAAKLGTRKSVGRASLAHIAWLSQHGLLIEGEDGNKQQHEYPADAFDHCEVDANGEETWSF